MPVNKKWIVFSLVTIVVMLISACSPAVTTPAVPAQPTDASAQATAAPVKPTPTEVPPAPAELKILRLADGASDIPTLDPSLSDQSISIQFIESTLLGLVRQNETTANMELSFAKSYEV